MEKLRVATVQFENRSGDKLFNLNRIETLATQATAAGAKVVVFHECCISGYSFARRLNEIQMTELSETVPGGASVGRLIDIARRLEITLCAGLFEKDPEGHIYNTYVVVNGDGLIARYRKLHPFINAVLQPGNEYCVFDVQGIRFGILICYDNNVIENVRATRLLGAEVILMPHVTMCTPSSRPGSGFVDPELWENRQDDPTSLRLEFDGMKGRAWLMKWLPARAYDNGVYVVFSNPIGMDDDQLKNGCSMIIDPFGDIVAECRQLGDDFVVTDVNPALVKSSGGYRYIEARRPALYRGIIGGEHTGRQKVAWL
jgi:predicted amidohydrolase